MGRLFFDSETLGVDIPDGARILEVCKENGVNFACQDGLCGSCVIKVSDGRENLTAPTLEEEDFFGMPSQDERLACQCALKHGTVRIKN